MVEQRRLASTEWVDIVNEDNEVIAQSSREQMRAQRLRHRATYIVVHDGMGKILVQRRTETKDFLPGMLDATAGGVVQADEQLLESARREAEEELGIAGVPFADTVCFTLKTNIAGFGARCLAAFPTGLSRFRKMKSAKCVG